VTPKVLLTGGHVPHDKQCPGGLEEAGYHHCCSSPSRPASVIADSSLAVIRDRQIPTISRDTKYPEQPVGSLIKIKCAGKGSGRDDLSLQNL
jgi:hypothetical protein